MNLSYRFTRNTTLIALIISLLLHIGLTIYLIFGQNSISFPFFDTLKQKQQQESLVEQESPQQSSSEWAETKAFSAPMGTPVIFKDEPDEDITPYRPQPETEQSSSLDNNALDQPKPTKDALSPQSSAPIEELVDVASTTTIAPPQKSQSSYNESKTTTISTQTAQPQPSAPTSTPLALKKKQITLAQFTQGVLHYAQEEGNHAVSMIGKKGGVPSDEQLKYERYLQKLDWCLRNSLSINQHSAPTHDYTPRTIHVLLALTKEGTLHRLTVTKSSGDQRLDSFVLFLFRDASSSFPPVPHYLPHNPFTITFVINTHPEHNNIMVNRR